MLSDRDKQFLRDLSVDPRWESVLKSIEKPAPTYRLNEDTEEAKLVNKFIYNSGVFEENKRILTILRGKASHD